MPVGGAHRPMMTDGVRFMWRTDGVRTWIIVVVQSTIMIAVVQVIPTCLPLPL